MTDTILDSTSFSYAIGDQQLVFRVPRLPLLKSAARRHADFLCMIIDAVADRSPPGIVADDDAIVRTATEFLLECGMGDEVLRDCLRGDELPELSKQARTDILANIVCAAWQMYGTLTLKAEVANIYQEFRSRGGRAPVRMPIALRSGSRH